MRPELPHGHRREDHRHQGRRNEEHQSLHQHLHQCRHPRLRQEPDVIRHDLGHHLYCPRSVPDGRRSQRLNERSLPDQASCQGSDEIRRLGVRRRGESHEVHQSEPDVLLRRPDRLVRHRDEEHHHLEKSGFHQDEERPDVRHRGEERQIHLDEGQDEDHHYHQGEASPGRKRKDCYLDVGPQVAARQDEDQELEPWPPA